MMNFFVLLAPPNALVRRLPLTRDVQDELETLFREQRNSLLARERQRLEFAAGFSPNENEISYITGYELPAAISDALQNPTACEPLHREGEEVFSVRGVVGSDTDSGETLFQVFDRRRLLAPGGRLSLIFSGDTFTRLEAPGMTMDSHLVAALSEGRLYFESYFSANRVLDLSAYYQEATDADIDQFCALEPVAVERPDRVRESADTWIRRRIAAVLASGILDRESPRTIRNKAEAFGINLRIVRREGRECLAIPEERKELKTFLCFLQEDFFTSVLTATNYQANSKRQLR